MGRNGRRRLGHDGAGGEVVRRAGSVSWPVRFNLRLRRLWRGSVPEKMSRIFCAFYFMFARESRNLKYLSLLCESSEDHHVVISFICYLLHLTNEADDDMMVL